MRLAYGRKRGRQGISRRPSELPGRPSPRRLREATGLHLWPVRERRQAGECLRRRAQSEPRTTVATTGEVTCLRAPCWRAGSGRGPPALSQPQRLSTQNGEYCVLNYTTSAFRKRASTGHYGLGECQIKAEILSKHTKEQSEILICWWYRHEFRQLLP